MAPSYTARGMPQVVALSGVLALAVTLLVAQQGGGEVSAQPFADWHAQLIADARMQIGRAHV